MSDQPNVDPTATPAAPDKASVWEDFIDIFYAPATVFERRAAGAFGIPMLVVAVLSALFFNLSMNTVQPAMDAEFARATAVQMKKNPQITAEQMATARTFQEKIAKYAAIIVIPIVILCVALTAWLSGKIVGAKESFAAATMVVSYAFVPRLLEGILNGVQGMLRSPDSLNGMMRLKIGPTFFMDPDTASPLLLALLGRVDVFTIWATVLIAIGLSVTGKIPRSQAAVAAVIVWVIGALPTLIPALMAS